jgi:hypothetical protein
MSEQNDPVGRLEQLLSAVREYDDPRRAGSEWKQIFRTLQKTDVPAGRATAVVGMRDVAGLEALIEQLRTPDAAPAETIDPDVLRKALKAFRKRLSLTVLDEESQLGRGPLSKGSDASVAAIEPPKEWPAAVWQELVRQGKLRYAGHGFYELPKP